MCIFSIIVTILSLLISIYHLLVQVIFEAKSFNALLSGIGLNLGLLGNTNGANFAMPIIVFLMVLYFMAFKYNIKVLNHLDQCIIVNAMIVYVFRFGDLGAENGWACCHCDIVACHLVLFLIRHDFFEELDHVSKCILALNVHGKNELSDLKYFLGSFVLAQLSKLLK